MSSVSRPCADSTGLMAFLHQYSSAPLVSTP